MRSSILSALGIAACVLAPASAEAQTRVMRSSDCVAMKLPGSVCRKNYSPLDPDPATEESGAAKKGTQTPAAAVAPVAPPTPKVERPAEPDVASQCDFEQPLSRSQIQLALTHCESVSVVAGGQQFHYTAPGIRSVAPPPAPSDLSGSEKDKYVQSVKGQVVTMLTDPASAKFRNVAYKETKKGNGVCGFVASNNGYGAATGEAKFVATGSMLYVFKDSDMNPPANGLLAWQELCNDKPK